MDIQQNKLSLKFYSFLCDIIGTKQVVNKRQQIFAVYDDLNRANGLFTISSGSKAEGLDLKGSDYDEMLVIPFAQVFEQLDYVKISGVKLPLIMDTENVKPGFTKLWTYHPPIDGPISDFIDWRNGCPYFSSTILRQAFCDKLLESNSECYIHGPCTSFSDGMFDQAYSLYCAGWVSQALPWINRTKYSWASDEVIRNILCSGVLFVPIGSKHSPETDLEWRISFSYAEKQLICVFNHVQLLCYALLKTILKDIILKTFGDLLCSYFMKTVMFWLCEETDVAFWKKENMLLCFMTCFRRLIYCVENKTCLHYFIPENNLFENRFENHHHDLLSKLHGLYDSGWSFLLQTETLQSFSSYLEPSLASNISLSTLLPCLRFLVITCNDRRDDTIIHKTCKRNISQSIRSSKKTIDLYMYSLSRMGQWFAQKRYDEELVQCNNKILYKNLRRSLSNLLIGLNHDAVSGWLLLASFFFKNKQYKISKTLIDYSLTKFTTERCEIFPESNLWQIPRYIEIQNIIGLKCLKNYTINSVIIRKHSSIIPVELKLLVNESSITFPAVVYAHHLNYLYYRAIGDYRETVQSYRNCVFHLERYEQSAQSG